MSDIYIELAENFNKWLINPGFEFFDDGQSYYDLIEMWSNAHNINLNDIDTNLLIETIKAYYNE